jgi:hypothetical protein
VAYALGAVAVVIALALWLVLRRRPRRPAAVRAEAGGTLDDAVRLRADGDLPRARAILDALDVAKGGGLRRLLRAVAAFESGDGAAARALGSAGALPGGVGAALVLLQLAAAAGRHEDVVGRDVQADLARALAAKVGGHDAALRAAMASLLLTDPELAAIVLGKELGLPAPPSTPRAAERYASVARGRDLFHRWGPERIAAFLAFWGKP